MRDIRYHLDPATGQPHIYDHGVDESEVEEVLAYPQEDGQSKEGARVAIGRTFAGRILKIIYSPDEDNMGIFVITAYDLTGKALLAFRRRNRRRS
jgi:hypothetical protein